MSERVKGWLQSLTIVLLTISAALLLVQTPLFGENGELLGWLSATEQTPSAAPAATAAASAPVRMLFTGEYARVGYDAVTTLGDEFESAGTLLGEAIGSAYGAESAAESAFLRALNAQGICFDFTTGLPLELIASWLGVAAPQRGQLDAVRRCLLCADDERVVLWVQDEKMGLRRFSTALGAAALRNYLSAAEGAGVELAADLSGDYEKLSPYTVVYADAAARPVLSASATEQTTASLLSTAEFNAHTASRYYESDTGALVVVQSLRVLRIGAEGTVSYQGGTAEPGSLYYVPADDAAPTVFAQVSAARALLNALCGDAVGDASLYVSGYTRRTNGCTVTFDYMAQGTPIRLSGGAHAASVTIEGQTITEFSLRLRQYAATEDETLLLPMPLSAAIAAAHNEGSELIIAYVDGGGDTVSAAYLAE